MVVSRLSASLFPLNWQRSKWISSLFQWSYRRLFYSISILTFARLGLKSNRTQAQSEPIAYVVVSNQAETTPGTQSGFNDRIGVEFGSCRRIIFAQFTIHISRPLHVKNKTTISQALMLDRMDLRTAQLNNRSPPAPAFYYLPCEEILHFRSSRYSYAFLVLF
jgi:hypothetical protein